MLAKRLEQLTEAYPDCIIAAFADLGTGVTLVTAGEANPPREALDELCAEAALTLGGEGAPAIGAETCPAAVKVVDHAIFVYIRAKDEPSDALMCMCRPEIDLQPFLENASSIMQGAT